MSRELTPKELEYIQKYYNIPNIVDSLVTQIGDTIMPTYTDEQKFQLNCTTNALF